MDWYKLSVEQVLAQQGADAETGLTAGEAQQRLAQFGRNELVERGVKSRWSIFLAQFKEIMVIILIIAAIISALLHEYLDATVIMIIVILIKPEGLFGVVFEEERG